MGLLTGHLCPSQTRLTGTYSKCIQKWYDFRTPSKYLPHLLRMVSASRRGTVLDAAGAGDSGAARRARWGGGPDAGQVRRWVKGQENVLSGHFFL